MCNTRGPEPGVVRGETGFLLACAGPDRSLGVLSFFGRLGFFFGRIVLLIDFDELILGV